MNKKYVFDKSESACKAAAERITYLSNKIISEKGRFTIALSGGNTPHQLYEMMALPPYSTLLDWKNIFVFWSDERCVPFTDENNNSHMAFTSLLNKVPVPRENIFPLPVNTDPPTAATTYEKTLQLFFKSDLPSFDLILLGLGDNGHTASLFPYTSILKERTRIVKEVFVDEMNAYRISFTARLINNAAHILFLVTGDAKGAIIKTIFSGTKDIEKFPVLLINSNKTNPEWYLDQAAASQLK